ncbi:hypothetical protein [Euzebya sp.]|uniref:hypothetical protein n=1 Tax=Euzebya sp. TaxID=1971409 RepID=UPI0035151404
MATVVVDARDFADGALPAVCVVTGRPADTSMELRARRPSPLGVLLLGGLFAFLLAGGAQSHVDGEVPVLDAVYEDLIRRLRRGRTALVGAGSCAVVAVVAVRVGTGGGASSLAQVLGLAGAVLAGGAAVWLVSVGLPRWWRGRRLLVTAVLRRDATWIDLRGVHPAFARAVDAADAVDQRR